MEQNNYIFCPQCGTKLSTDAKFCNKCGTKLNPTTGLATKCKKEDTSRRIEYPTQGSNNGYTVSHQEDHFDKRPNYKKRVFYTILFALLALILKICAGVNNNEYDRPSTDSYYDAENTEYSNTHQSKKYSDITFYNEIDVRGYLLCHKFKSDDGTTISFSDNANQIWMNGRCLSSNISVIHIRRNGAVFTFSGPWSTGSIGITVEDGLHALVDLNDQTVYKEQ